MSPEQMRIIAAASLAESETDWRGTLDLGFWRDMGDQSLYHDLWARRALCWVRRFPLTRTAPPSQMILHPVASAALFAEWGESEATTEGRERMQTLLARAKALLAPGVSG